MEMYLSAVILVFMSTLTAFQIHESAFHNARLLLDIEAGSPIILIPHSSRTSDVLVADLGTLTVKNCFKLDGQAGTFNEGKYKTDEEQTPTEDKASASSRSFTRSSVSRTSSQTSQNSMRKQSSDGIITSRSNSQTDASQSRLPHPLTHSLFDDLLPPRSNLDPMTDSIYGGLDLDVREDDPSEKYDPTDVMSEGSSVDPSSPRSSTGLNISLSELSFAKERSSCTSPTSLRLSSSTSDISPLSNVTITGRNVFACTDGEDVSMVTNTHKCLMDVLEIQLTDMDLFAAERVERRNYKGKHLHQDLEYPSCVIQRQVGSN